MKKLMSMMLGLSLVVGSVSLFAADDKDTGKSTAKKKGGKKKGSAKSTDKK